MRMLGVIARGVSCIACLCTQNPRLHGCAVAEEPCKVHTRHIGDCSVAAWHLRSLSTMAQPCRPPAHGVQLSSRNACGRMSRPCPSMSLQQAPGCAAACLALLSMHFSGTNDSTQSHWLRACSIDLWQPCCSPQEHASSAYHRTPRVRYHMFWDSVTRLARCPDSAHRMLSECPASEPTGVPERGSIMKQCPEGAPATSREAAGSRASAYTLPVCCTLSRRALHFCTPGRQAAAASCDPLSESGQSTRSPGGRVLHLMPGDRAVEQRVGVSCPSLGP